MKLLDEAASPSNPTRRPAILPLPGPADARSFPFPHVINELPCPVEEQLLVARGTPHAAGLKPGEHGTMGTA